MVDYKEIEELKKLKEDGIISEEEFEAAKKKASNTTRIGDTLKKLSTIVAFCGGIGTIIYTLISLDSMYTEGLAFGIFAVGAISTAISAGVLYAIGEISNDIKEIKDKI